MYALVFKYAKISTRNPKVIVGTWNGIYFIDVFYNLDDPNVIVDMFYDLDELEVIVDM